MGNRGEAVAVGAPVPAHRRALPVLLAVLLALAGVGCGDGDGGPPTEDVGAPPPDAEAGPEWQETEVPLVPAADTSLLTAADGDRVVVVVTSEEGAVTSAIVADDGAVETGPPLATGAEYLRLAELARFDGAWWAVGSGGTEAVPSRPDDWQLAFDLHVVRSEDGLTWTEVDVTGLDGPAEVTGLAATDDGIVAVGHDQSGNVEGAATGEGFRARAWRSADGAAWEPVEVPDDGTRFGVSSLTAVDDGLLAVGSGEDGTIAWRSEDGGASWDEIAPEGLGDGVALTHVVAFGDGLLASGAGPQTEETEAGAPVALHRSDDGGRSWTRLDGPPPSSDGGWAPLHPAGDRVFTTLSTYFDPGSNPRACYADPEQCSRGSETVLYEGDGTGAWSRIDLSALDMGEYGDVDGVVATDERLVLWSTATEAATTFWSVGLGTDLPTADEPEIAVADVIMLEEGEEPEVGVRYAQPLYTLCGMDWLYLGDEPWQRTDDGAEHGEGGTIYGFATLGEDGTVTYEDADGEVLATYGPPTREPEPCM